MTLGRIACLHQLKDTPRPPGARAGVDPGSHLQVDAPRSFPSRALPVLCCLTVLFLPSALSAIHPDRHDLKFERLSLEQGLSQSLVLCIAQDDQGFLWFGTEDGLNRYDGYEFKVFRHSAMDSSSLANNYVYSLYKDSQGILWIGTWGGGLDCYDARHNKFLHSSRLSSDASPGLDKITGILEDSRKVLWVTSWGGGLGRVNRTTGRVDRVSLFSARHQPVLFDTLHGIAEDTCGRIWIGGFRTGAIVYDPLNGTCVVYRHDVHHPKSLSYDNTRVISRDRNGVMWTGTWGGGLNRFDPSRGFVNYRHSAGNQRSLSSDIVLSILQDSDKRLWIGTQDGLNCFDSASHGFTRYTSDPSDPHRLASSRVMCLFEDAGGVIWLGTGDGLAKLTKHLQFFRPFFPPGAFTTSTSNTNVFGLCEDSGGNIWMGTYGAGVYCYRRSTGTFKRYHHSETDPWSLINDNVFSVCVDIHKTVWIGTYGGGVDRYVPAKDGFAHQRHNGRDDNSLVNDYVRCLLGDRHGRIWIGTGGKGLDRFDPGQNRFTHYRHDDGTPRSLSDDEIECLVEDKSGTIWIGTGSGGVSRYVEGEGTLSPYLHDPARSSSLSNNHVYAIHEDAQGMIWMATSGGGLNRLDPLTGRFECFTEKDGLANDVVYGIVEPQKGILWVSTNKGLSRFNVSTRTFKNFDAADGLMSQEFNFNSYCLLRSGEALFGGIKGVNIFDPDAVRENAHVPPIVLTSFDVSGDRMRLEESLQFTEGVHLTYKQNFFSFEFSALDFVAPAKNQYAYRLEGMDDNWKRPGTRRFAGYTQVEPGEYVFRVKGSNNDGLWNTQGRSFKIVIKPPFWATLWFKCLIVLLVLGIVFFVYHYRVGRLVEVERMRLRIANDLHDDIGSNLSGIALTNEMVASSLPQGNQQRSQLLAAGKNARQTANALRDIVWLIHPEHDTVEDMIFKLRDTASVLLGEIEHSFQCPEDALKKIRDIGFKRNLFLVFKEILHNIASHSSATNVSIQIKEHRRLLEMRIADNGRGFDPASQTSGNGLKSLRLRASQMGGSVTIESLPGRGTTVIILARIP